MGFLDPSGDWDRPPPILKNKKNRNTVDSLLQPNESYLALGVWQSKATKTQVLKGTSVESTDRKYHALGLTEEHLYVANFTFGTWSSGFKSSSACKLSTITEWNFVRHMGKKGELVGYQFTYSAAGGREVGDYTAVTVVSEPFKEQFESVMTRFAALASSVDVAGQLSAMHQLWTEGVLSDEEYEKSKALFLGRSPDQQQVAENNLRSLKQLKDSGVLSEAEFAAKKWEILSC